MASESRRSDTPLIQQLRAEPERFSFVQAARALERLATPEADAPPRLGFDAEPRRESVRLRAALELAFPASEVLSVQETGDGGAPTLLAGFLGLVGPSGVLPDFYTSQVLEADRGKNTALGDFLALFEHRALSFFLRASEKYRLAESFARADGDGGDAISAALYALVGLGQPSLRSRQNVSDQALAFYAGHFSHHPRTASGLASVLSDYFGRPVRIEQYRGRWTLLPPSESTRLGAGAEGQASYAQLGVDALCGARAFDVNASFRIVVGPLDYDEFVRFLPDSTLLAELTDLAMTYVGPAFGFDLQLGLRGEEVPALQLTADPDKGGRLGWNTWLPTDGARPNAVDAVFEIA
jgi:type VI secretion system protein ImpH